MIPIANNSGGPKTDIILGDNFGGRDSFSQRLFRSLDPVLYPGNHYYFEHSFASQFDHECSHVCGVNSDPRLPLKLTTHRMRYLLPLLGFNHRVQPNLDIRYGLRSLRIALCQGVVLTEGLPDRQKHFGGAWYWSSTCTGYQGLTVYCVGS